MNDLLNEILGLLKKAWRFRWWGLAAAWAFCMVGWAVVSMQQPVYEASARVYVDTKSMLRALLDEQIVDTTLDEQLGFVREAMLGSTQLEVIAREVGFIDQTSTSNEIVSVVGSLQRTIRISSLNDSLPPGLRLARAPADDTYTISYENNNPEVAAAVVKKLLEAFERDAITGKRTSSERAGQFLREQIATYESRLRDAETKLAAFNQEYYDRLPNLQGGYFAELQTKTEELADARKSLSLVESRLSNIERQLRGEAWVVGSSAEIDPASTEGRIRTARANLDELLLRFTDSHPDVRALRENLAILEEKKIRELEMIGEGDANVLSNNPVYQALQISKNEAEAEIATLRADVGVREARLNHLQGLINEMPKVEAERSQLNRDYEVIKSHYQSLLNNLERERLSSEVVASDEIEFRVIDPPVAPTSPVSVLPHLLHAAVFMAGLGGAVALAILLAHLRPVVSSLSELTQIIDAPVLGAISRTSTASVGLRNSWFYFSSGCLGFAFFGVLYAETAGMGLREVF